jgi:hypothetical protein
MTNHHYQNYKKGGGGKEFVFNFANLCRISAPVGMETDDP